MAFFSSSAQSVLTQRDFEKGPCLVKTADVLPRIPNFKDSSDGVYAEVLEKMQQQREIGSSSSTTQSGAASASAPTSRVHELCTPSQVVFTLPPRTPPVQIRYRTISGTGRNAEKSAWVNPVTDNNGMFFSPTWSEKAGGLARKDLPPPLVLSPKWERDYIKCDGIAEEQEGKLRLFALTGIAPSVKSSGISGKIFNMAGQGVYGEHTIEIEFKPAEGAWDEDDGWGSGVGVPATVTYPVPPTDPVSAVLTIAMNWIRSSGVSTLSDTGQAWVRDNWKMLVTMVSTLMQDIVRSMEPWIENHHTLSLVLKEPRHVVMRRYAARVWQMLQKAQMLDEIPNVLVTLRPGIESLVASVDGKSTSNDVMQVHEGEDLTLTAKAKPVVAAGDVKLWWLVLSCSQSGVDMEALVDQVPIEEVGKGGRVRTEEMQADGYVSSDLHLKGLNMFGRPYLEAGCQCVIRVVSEEPGTHEDDHRDIHIEVVSSGQALKRGEDLEKGSSAVPRITAPCVMGMPQQKSHDELVELFKKNSQSQELSEEELRATVKIVLEELGHSPKKLDLDLIVRDMPRQQEDAAERFATWYADESIFSKSMVTEGWRQMSKRLMKQRNAFLEETLEIPPEKWGFGPEEWAGIFPEMTTMQQHLERLGKKSILRLWASRDAPEERWFPETQSWMRYEKLKEHMSTSFTVTFAMGPPTPNPLSPSAQPFHRSVSSNKKVLGMSVSQEKSFLVVTGISEGLAKQWNDSNQENPGCLIQPGCRILQVNAEQNVERMSRLLGQAVGLQIKMQKDPPPAELDKCWAGLRTGISGHYIDTRNNMFFVTQKDETAHFIHNGSPKAGRLKDEAGTLKLEIEGFVPGIVQSDGSIIFSRDGEDMETWTRQHVPLREDDQLADVFRSYGRGSIKQYLSASLSEACWGKIEENENPAEVHAREVQRRKWVIDEKRTSDAFMHFIALALAEYSRDCDRTRRREDERREETEMEYQQQNERILGWIKQNAQHGGVELPDGVQPMQVVQYVVSDEVVHFLQRSLWPVIKDYLLDEFLPDLTETFKEMMMKLYRKYRILIWIIALLLCFWILRSIWWAFFGHITQVQSSASLGGAEHCELHVEAAAQRAVQLFLQTLAEDDPNDASSSTTERLTLQLLRRRLQAGKSSEHVV
eukprot:TRINITY_DN8903_c0_g1_i1.p1 TRINITY_DN8903_c0_g1~~TRINITY_DN8903_c0_g1_i1.p1  ORF type:complete len:1154 (+),score=212.46 TRINITY_DN8903_c0_g1_i1:68-3529(+)